MTISQSYKLYCLEKPQTSNNPEYTYIYWQAMHGDMMLTITNEILESGGKDQSNIRCLVCYVAQKPSTKRDDYHEEYSYLNDGHPIQHDVNVHQGTFRAKSNVFYRGCNTDDFLTFSLKISHKTGEATLSHAGPNSIYSHEQISYKFNKSDLDLSRIDYVHVSGGKQDVPIRNLTINHEPVSELHPSFDKDFKIDTSSLIRRHTVSDSHIAHSAYNRGASVHEKNRFFEVRNERSVSVGSAQSARSKPRPSFFKRLTNSLLNRSATNKEQASVEPKSSKEKPYIFYQGGPPEYNGSGVQSPPHNELTRESSSSKKATPESPSSKQAKPESAPLISSRLPPCSDSIYCLNQYFKDHTNQYSHPCRFNELCQRQADESHLTHRHHNVPRCSEDRICHAQMDPIHRAKFRHSGLSDFLLPCRFQETCHDKSADHRMKYFHGEEILSFKSKLPLPSGNICLLKKLMFSTISEKKKSTSAIDGGDARGYRSTAS